MKILVWRSGGLLGRRVEWDVVVDEQPDPDQWYLLIAELPWDERPSTLTTPDRYIYRIRCDPHEVVIPEQELTGPWRELVDRVRDADSHEKTREQHPKADSSCEPDQKAGTDVADSDEPASER
ncbi:MAG: protealysin inhibitor emfourin [Rhodoglobus sp.]